MTTGNRPTRASCALAALVAIVLLAAVSCGGAGHPAATTSASQLVGQALGGRSAVRSGQVELSLSLLAPSSREVFMLHSATRFRLAAAGAAPTLALTLATVSRSGSGPRRALRVALASGPRGLSLSVQGRHVPTSPEAQRALQAGYAQLASGAAGGGQAIAPLGLDASSWLSAPRFVTPASDRSAEAHVRAGLALAPFLSDVERLASLSAGLEQAGGLPGRPGTSAPALALARAALEESGAGTVDLFADPRSQLPRSLSASVSLHPGSGAGAHPPPPISVSLKMSFAALGQPARAGAT